MKIHTTPVLLQIPYKLKPVSDSLIRMLASYLAGGSLGLSHFRGHCFNIRGRATSCRATDYMQQKIAEQRQAN
jgi:hypothetical protein